MQQICNLTEDTHLNQIWKGTDLKLLNVLIGNFQNVLISKSDINFFRR